MKIQVKVKTNSRHELVEKLEDGSFLVKVNVPPVEGKANKRVIELLAKYFSVAKSKVTLKSGPKSKIKLFEVL